MNAGGDAVGGVSASVEIGELPITPDAEPLANVRFGSANEEQGFYAQSAREYQLAAHRQNLGYLGKFFGANSTAPTNIAGLVAVVSLGLLALTLFVSVEEVVEVRKLLAGVLSSSLAFIFGASTKK